MVQTDIFSKLTHKQKIEQALKQAGKWGLMGHELAQITHRFSEYIRQLKQEYEIEVSHVKGGTYRYKLGKRKR